MLSKFNKKILSVQLTLFAGIVMGIGEAQAQSADFSTIARNVNQSIEEIPGLITGVAYLLGLVLGVMGILKVKDHVDNPSQVPMREGIVRMIAGGALFGLPILYDAMLNTIGTTSNLVAPATLNRIQFNIR